MDATISYVVYRHFSALVMLRNRPEVSSVIVLLTLLRAVFASAENVEADEQRWFVSWNAPFLASSSGYGSEATSFLVGLNSTLGKEWGIAAGLAHGDAVDYEFVQTLPPNLLQLMQKADENQQRLNPSNTIMICHTEPGAWSVPTPFYESPVPCPYPHMEWLAIVGRTMFETDRLPSGWDERMNKMDEIWVPTQHHKVIFERDGVTKPVRVIGQGIDVDFWDPDRVKPLEWDKIDPYSNCEESDFKFLSVFKWEKRKGPDILIPGFWNAFPEGKGACLIVVTSLYHDDETKVLKDLKKYWRQTHGDIDVNAISGMSIPPGIVLLSGLPLEDLVRLYRSVDAFVLPSRGEGWGRPYMEAMAMGLPVIATNWSGPTEFVSDTVGYLLPILGLVDAGLKAFPNHQWANPDGEELKRLLSLLKDHPQEAQVKGKKARTHVVEHWSNVEVAKQVVEHLERLSHQKATGSTKSRVEL